MRTVEIGLDELGGIAPEEDGDLLLLIRGVLDDDAAVQLEDRNIGYIDSAERLWLPGQPRTTKRRISSARPSHLRDASTKLLQLIADHPDERWTQRRLAEDGETTQVTAHTLLRHLEQDGLVIRHGERRGSERRVADRRLLRRWLAENARQGRAATVSAFVDDPLALDVPDDMEIVLTGAAAASHYGLPVLTSVPTPAYRVVVNPEHLEDVPSKLGGFRTDKGSNLLLIADPHRLGFIDKREHDGVNLAPPSRVLLDLYLGSRGEAAADVFLDLWGEKIL